MGFEFVRRVGQVTALLEKKTAFGRPHNVVDQPCCRVLSERCLAEPFKARWIIPTTD